MTQNFISERLANGVEIHEVDFMKRGHVVRKYSELGQPVRRERLRTGNGDVYVGVRPGGTFRPGPKPDDVDIGAQNAPGQLRDFLCDLPRPSHEFLVDHVPSVAVLVMMSTGWVYGKIARLRALYTVTPPTLASPLSATYNARVSLHLIL